MRPLLWQCMAECDGTILRAKNSAATCTAAGVARVRPLKPERPHVVLLQQSLLTTNPS